MTSGINRTPDLNKVSNEVYLTPSGVSQPIWSDAAGDQLTFGGVLHKGPSFEAIRKRGEQVARLRARRARS